MSGSSRYSSTQNSSDVEDVNDAPLLVNDSAKNYNTTDVMSDTDDGSVEPLSDLESYGSEGSWDALHDMGPIGDIVLQAQVMKDEVDEKVRKLHPVVLRVLVAFFALLGIASLVGAILYTLNIFPDEQSTIQLAVLSIAIGGNCLGSWALFYSGAFKSELAGLAKGIKRLEIAADHLHGHVQHIKKHRRILEKSHGKLEKEVGQLSKQIDRFNENDDDIRETTIKLKNNQDTLEEENEQMKFEWENLTKTEKNYVASAKDMQNDQMKIKSYNENAENRIEQLSEMLETIKPSNENLEDQVHRFEELHEDVELESNRINRRVDRTTKDVEQIFDAIRDITKRQERVMLYQLMERILMAGDNQDLMDLEDFKQFVVQIPMGLQKEDFQDVWLEWFQNMKGDAPGIDRIKIMEMIDEITQDKVNKERTDSSM